MSNMEEENKITQNGKRITILIKNAFKDELKKQK